jgi:hypothetical protein
VFFFSYQIFDFLVKSLYSTKNFGFFLIKLEHSKLKKIVEGIKQELAQNIVV